MAKRHVAGSDLLSQIRRCQELILARSGVDDFFETVRLLVAKALHEKLLGGGRLSFDHASMLLEQHADTVERFVDGGAVFSAPPEVIEECLSVLHSVHLTNIGFEALDAAFETMTARTAKADKGQFFTPRHVVNFCIDVLSPTSQETICDPACGSGAFLKAAYDHIGKKTQKNLYGFDISPRAAKTAELMSFLGCNDSLSVRQLDSLELYGSSLLGNEAVSIEMAMAGSAGRFPGFDIIATNPPFAGDVGNTEYATQYELGRGGGRVERDVLFIERCLTLLKPAGRLAIVLPDNKVSGTRYSHVRQWLLKRAKLVAVVSLHAYTFRPHTSQKAAIIFAQKLKDSDFVPAPYPISMYRSDLPGKTSSGELVVSRAGQIDHDLDPICKSIKSKWNK